MTREQRNTRNSLSKNSKKHFKLMGITKCEVCGWPSYSNFDHLLIAAHVIPGKYDAECASTNSQDNLLLLCPNHARISDFITGVHGSNGVFAEYRGPRTRSEMLDHLRSIDDDPETWVSNNSLLLVGFEIEQTEPNLQS